MGAPSTSVDTKTIAISSGGGGVFLLLLLGLLIFFCLKKRKRAAAAAAAAAPSSPSAAQSAASSPDSIEVLVDDGLLPSLPLKENATPVIDGVPPVLTARNLGDLFDSEFSEDM